MIHKGEGGTALVLKCGVGKFASCQYHVPMCSCSLNPPKMEFSNTHFNSKCCRFFILSIFHVFNHQLDVTS